MAFYVIFVLFINCVDSLSLRGVPISNLPLYTISKSFVCFDGSKTVPHSFINDNFCDCNDGSDEPGTSACPNNMFYCENIGYKSSKIFSSKVDDGLCHCCDGSDELAISQGGIVNCPNTCEALTLKVYNIWSLKINENQEGFNKKLQMIEKSKTLLSEKEKNLQILEDDLKSLEEQKKIVEDEKNTFDNLKDREMERFEELKEFERQEQEKNELCHKIFKSFEEINGKIGTYQVLTYLNNSFNNGLFLPIINDTKSFLEKCDKNDDGVVNFDDIPLNFPFFVQNEIDKEEFCNLFKNFTNCYTCNNLISDSNTSNEENAEISQLLNEDVHNSQETTTSIPEYFTQLPSYFKDKEKESDNEEDDEEEEEDYNDDKLASNNKDELGNEKYPPNVQNRIDICRDLGRNFSHLESECNKLKKEINDLKKVDTFDLGEELQFAPLLDQCFNYADHEYTYKFCPFNTVHQGHTLIGKFSEFKEDEGDKYYYMSFTDGQACWNGPTRQTRVKMMCGKENKLVRINEPSMCFYTMTFMTPLKCSKPLNKDASLEDILSRSSSLGIEDPEFYNAGSFIQDNKQVKIDSYKHSQNSDQFIPYILMEHDEL